MSKSLCLVSVMLQRLPAVLSRIGIILASPLVRPPIALGRGHDFARPWLATCKMLSRGLSGNETAGKGNARVRMS